MLVLVKLFLASFSLFSTYSQGVTGVEIYNISSQRCCDGAVRDVPAAEPGPTAPTRSFFTCCGADVYKYERDPKNTSALVAKCCQNNLYREVNQTARCCGTKLFEATTHACYQWGGHDAVFLSEIGEVFEVLPLPQENNDRGEIKVCGKSKDEGEFYNPVKQICCSGVLYNQTMGMQCCGDSHINRTVSKCCEEYVKGDGKRPWKMAMSVIHTSDAIPLYSECCDGRVIDANKQSCCAGAVVDFPANFSKESFLDYSTSIHSFDFVDRPYCCGKELMTDVDTEVCVDRERVQSRENRNQIWCDDGLHQIDGEKPLNVYCIEDQVWKLNETELICSVNGANVRYDSTKSVCTENKLIDVANTRQQDVCGKSMRDINAGVVLPNLLYRPQRNNIMYAID